VYKVLGESPKETDHLEDQGIGGKMGSEWILGRMAWGCGLDSTGSGQGPVAGCGECGDEPSGSCATELVKAISLHAMKVFGGRRCIAHTHSQPRHSQRHAPAELYSLGKDPRYPLDRRVGGPHSRSGHRG
jgi:hypothetical protein